MSDYNPDLKSKNYEILPLDMDDLPEFFQQKAAREINYSPDTVEKSLREMKKLIAKDGVLKELSLPDKLLSMYLTGRKFNVDRAFKLKDGYRFYIKHPEVHLIPSYEVLLACFTDEVITVLPKRCQDGCAVLYANANKAANYSEENLKQCYDFVILQALRKPMTQVNGFKLILNLDAGWEVMRLGTPNNVYLYIYGLFVICPGRFKEFHILNMLTVGKILWQLMRIFLPPKLKDRIHIHKTRDTLLDFFDKEVLPSHLGGELKDHDMTWWLKKYLTPEERIAFEFNVIERPFKEYTLNNE